MKILEFNRKEYYVNLNYLRKMLTDTIAEGKSLRKELDHITERYGEKIDLQSTEDVTRFIKFLLRVERLKESKITNEALVRWFKQTKDVFFIKLKQYRRCRDKYRKIAMFINSVTGNSNGMNKCLDDFISSNLKIAIMDPKFLSNKNGGISMSQPPMPFSIAETMELLDFNVAIRFKSNDQMVDFLNAYEDIIWEDAKGKRLMVRGEVLYAEIMVSENDIIPFSNDDDNTKQLIEKFNVNYCRRTGDSLMVIIKG